MSVTLCLYQATRSNTDLETSTMTKRKTVDDELMNIKEAAAFLKCAVSTMYRDTAAGAIPCIHKGKRVLFLKSDLIEWLKTMREVPSFMVVQK